MTEQQPRPSRLSRLRAGRQLPAPIEALRALDARTRPNLKRAVPAVLIALASFGFGDRLGGIPRTHDTTFAMFGWSLSLTKGQVSILVLGLSVLFVVAGVIATRSVAGELGRVSELHGGVAAASAVRLVCMVLGYGFVALAVLALLRVDLGNLLVGGAVTGVIVGIAAQQTLGNVFAGLVLLFARPYVPGQRVKIRSGSMGGPFDGVIVTAGLMYTTIDTEEGLVSMPNSGLLAAAIGPFDGEPAEDSPDGTAASGDSGIGPGGNPATGPSGSPA